MKKKVLALLLALSCVSLMVACKGSERVVEESEIEEEVEVEEPEEEEIEEDLDEEEVEEEEEVVETEDKKDKPEVSAPADLSDDLYDFQISIDGVVYQFPMWYSDFEALGWEYDGDATETLSSNQYTTTQVWKKDGVRIYTRFANLSMNTVTFAESMVAGITLDNYYLKDCDWDIVLPGGITWGVSNTDDIKAAYGDPSSDYDGDNYYKMTYKYDYYQEISLYVYKDTDALQQIELQNVVELEGADNSVSGEVPDVIKNYEAPAKLGDDLYTFNFDLEGNIYKLPCPVSELIANGFKIDEAKTEMEVAAGRSGWVSLKYNNQTLKVLAENYADYATTIENCMITAVKSSDYDPKFALVLPGNIKRGDTEADVEKAVKAFNYEKEVSDSGFVYYTITNPNESKLDKITIVIHEDKVVTIEMKNSKEPK